MFRGGGGSLVDPLRSAGRTASPTRGGLGGGGGVFEGMLAIWFPSREHRVATSLLNCWITLSFQ